jgi:hypothetical protein
MLDKKENGSVVAEISFIYWMDENDIKVLRMLHLFFVCS